MTTLTEVFQGDRREQATDARGLPKSYARALKALDGVCAHCSQRAVIATGSGVGLCAAHRRMRVDDIARLERARQQLAAAKHG
jgi:hypothetical protein